MKGNFWNMKYKRYIACLCSVLLLCACGKSYEIKPTGTNDTTEAGYFEVPAQYRDGSVSFETVAENIVTDTNAKDTESIARERKAAFEDIFNSSNLYVDVQRVRTYGESTESARIVCAYTENDDVYYAAYNANDEKVQEVYGNTMTVYLVDTSAKKRKETERTNYKYCDKQVLCDMFTYKDIEYIATYADVLEDRELICDEYKTTDSVVRYYYDTAGNLIILRTTTETDDTNTLFRELKTYVDETLFNTYEDFDVEKLITD